MRQTSPRRMSTRYFIASRRADRYYTFLKGDLEVVAAKGNLIFPLRNSTTGCSFMSYPGQIIIIIIIIIVIIIIIIIIIIINVKNEILLFYYFTTPVSVAHVLPFAKATSKSQTNQGASSKDITVKSTIYNLSSRKLNKDEISVLELGLSFCPAQKKLQ